MQKTEILRSILLLPWNQLSFIYIDYFLAFLGTWMHSSYSLAVVQSRMYAPPIPSSASHPNVHSHKQFGSPILFGPSAEVLLHIQHDCRRTRVQNFTQLFSIWLQSITVWCKPTAGHTAQTAAQGRAPGRWRAPVWSWSSSTRCWWRGFTTLSGARKTSSHRLERRIDEWFFIQVPTSFLSCCC